MPNTHIQKRLEGIQAILNGAHQAGTPMSSASKGTERQAFIENFLKEVLPPIFRFGTGEVTDATNNRSGQLDVVVEYPIAPSLPSTAGSPRLYLAESLAAVLEIKSNLASQWSEAEGTATQLASIQRKFGAIMTMGRPPQQRIPLFIVGYTGWATNSTLKDHVDSNPNIDGALIINPGLFYSKFPGGLTANGPWALWGLISSLHQITSSLKAAATDPIQYAR